MQDTTKDKQRSATVYSSPVSSSVYSQAYKSPTLQRKARLKRDSSLRYSTPDIGYSAEAEFDNRARGENNVAELSRDLPQWVDRRQVKELTESMTYCQVAERVNVERHARLEIEKRFEEKSKELERTKFKLREAIDDLEIANKAREALTEEYELKINEYTRKTQEKLFEVIHQITNEKESSIKNKEVEWHDKEKHYQDQLKDFNEQIDRLKAQLLHYGLYTESSRPPESIEKPVTEDKIRSSTEEVSLLDMLKEMGNDKGTKELERKNRFRVLSMPPRPNFKSEEEEVVISQPIRREISNSMSDIKKAKKEKKAKKDKKKKYEVRPNTSVQAVTKESLMELQQREEETRLRKHTIMWSSLSIQLQSELAKRIKSQENEKELKKRAEKINLEIGLLITRKASDESIIKEAGEAKKRIPDLEKKILVKRKEFEEVTREMKIEKQRKQKIKEQFEEKDNEMSILQNVAIRQVILKRIRKIKVVPNVDSVQLCVCGPNIDGNLSLDSEHSSIEDQEKLKQLIEETVSGKSVSSYPMKLDLGIREGEPICDRFYFCHYDNCTIATIADGCGWGPPSQEAAEIATIEFTEYLRTFKQDVYDTRIAARLMLRALKVAHEAIIKKAPPESVFMAGTTTILGGIVLPLAAEDSEETKVTVAQPGDCKAYQIHKKTGKIVDVTEGNRKNINDPKDPGGRIGPYTEPNGDPDLRNLIAYTAPCEDGDLFLLVSDGVHDNLDPQQLGKKPEEFGLESEDGTWKTVKETEKASKIKSQFSEKLLQDLLGNDLTPKHVVDTLTHYAFNLTATSREFMETHPNTRLPPDLAKYPGKMDHTTAMCFRVGKKPLSKIKRVDSGVNKEKHRTSSF